MGQTTLTHKVFCSSNGDGGSIDSGGGCSVSGGALSGVIFDIRRESNGRAFGSLWRRKGWAVFSPPNYVSTPRLCLCVTARRQVVGFSRAPRLEPSARLPSINSGPEPVEGRSSLFGRPGNGVFQHPDLSPTIWLCW